MFGSSNVQTWRVEKMLFHAAGSTCIKCIGREGHQPLRIKWMSRVLCIDAIFWYCVIGFYKIYLCERCSDSASSDPGKSLKAIFLIEYRTARACPSNWAAPTALDCRVLPCWKKIYWARECYMLYSFNLVWAVLCVRLSRNELEESRFQTNK